ncbi:hypothetical protein MKX03_021136 [Papaver bracteatum]|nr:hypothetical protein MKX03_021136 [Papaver bracteatum]
MGVGEDRLSNLYDPLLHHIFSFLPFKCVVATCILSKRWKELWISSPVLNIQEWRRYSRSRFLETRDGNTDQEDEYWSQETTELVNFMDRMLHQSHPLFRNDLPNIKKFCLDYDTTYASRSISGWILTLMMRKVEEISLRIPIEFVVPMSLFTCETLTVLKIEMSGDLSTKMKKIGTLLDAHIDITFESRTNKNSKRRCGLKNLVEGISSVKILHISGSTLESFFWNEMNQIVPTFHDLRRLDVTSKLSDCMFFALLKLLHKMPNLESVVIAQASPSPLCSLRPLI